MESTQKSSINYSYSYVDGNYEYIVCISGTRIGTYRIPLDEEPLNVGKMKLFTGGDVYKIRDKMMSKLEN